MFNKIISIMIIILSIGLIYIIYEFKNNNIEKFSGDQLSTIKEEINKQYNMDIEAIRNLGAISKSLLTGKNYHSTNTATPGTLTIPGNMVVEGWGVSVPVGTVIIWALNTPPPPNTTGFKLSGFRLSGADKWAPCNGENGTPDLRNRFPIGQGDWNKALKSLIGGNVPIRNHIHAINSDGNHYHSMSFQNDDWNGRGGGSTGLEDDSTRVYHRNTNSAGAHSHGGQTAHAAIPSNKGIAGPYRLDNYNHATVPYSTVMQYWIRVR